MEILRSLRTLFFYEESLCNYLRELLSNHAALKLLDNPLELWGLAPTLALATKIDVVMLLALLYEGLAPTLALAKNIDVVMLLA